ncbi:hypothetical protein Ga0609869_000148 [Rhodovulum iodosum]|uniref:Uncharacterized protein n=1 Tax=Rhodovulum iodosum TaxID=68291 RepID=A0ABV3XNA3_9RHOB
MWTALKRLFGPRPLPAAQAQPVARIKFPCC